MTRLILKCIAIGFACMAAISIYNLYMARSNTCILLYENTPTEFSVRIRNQDGQLVNRLQLSASAERRQTVELPQGDYIVEMQCAQGTHQDALHVVGSGEYTLRCPR